MKGHHCAFISTFHVKKVLIKVRSRRMKTISSCNLLLRILLSNGSIRREYNKHKKNVLNKPPIKLGNKFAELVAADIPLEFSVSQMEKCVNQLLQCSCPRLISVSVTTIIV